MNSRTLPGNLIPFHRHDELTGQVPRSPRLTRGVELLGRDEVLDRLELLGEVAPSAPLSFLLVQLRMQPEIQRLPTRIEHRLVQTLAMHTAGLLRATDALGVWTASSLAVVLQGAGATAASAVAARISFHLNQFLADEAPGFEAVVYAATGRGLNAAVLPAAALDTFDECS